MIHRLLPYSGLKRLYGASPGWVRELYAAIPFAWRAGSAFRRTSRVIRRTEQLPWPELRALQGERLRELLQHAHDHVPFYREAMREIGFDPARALLPGDLARLPLVSKSMLQDQPERFQAEAGVGEPVYADNTGGSSGTPFGFLKPNSMYPIEQAYMLAQWRRVGYEPTDRKLTLRGRVFTGGRQRWAYNPIYRELVLSSYHLDADTVTAALIEARRFKPRFMHGYPSAITRFLQVAVEAGLQPPTGIRAVLCGSEPLYEFQRQFIRETLGCRVYSWYGQSECVLLAGECEHSTAYHSFPLYGVLELVDEVGGVITEPDVEGEIVGTALHNRAMPFIRYRTGDRGVYDAPGPCACGRSYPRLRTVTGRKQEFIYTSGERAVPVTAFVFGQHFDAFERIRGMQLVQDRPGELRVHLLTRGGYDSTDEEEIRRKMEASVDHDLHVRFQYVDQLALNAAGKTPFVIQRWAPKA